MHDLATRRTGSGGAPVGGCARDGWPRLGDCRTYYILKCNGRTLIGCVYVTAAVDVVGTRVGCGPMGQSTDNSAQLIDRKFGDGFEQMLEFAAFPRDWMTIPT